MAEEEIIGRLTPVFRSVFRDPGIIISPAMTAADVKAWDSLSHINLIVAVEKEFTIALTARDARSLKNVGDLIALIAKKTGS